MRLRSLDLIRYGHFTGKSIDLPAGVPDVHVIFGRNEAGKSTALTAIGDLLFGIPRISPYNFLHDYNAMKLGAVLENGRDRAAVRRRKGNENTLLGSDDLVHPLGQNALSPFLSGTDREFFERMFSLDHARLEKGGQDILAAQDDVGQMLFSAGTGISGLRERLAALKDEANRLWGVRRSGSRRYSVARDQLDEANQALRELTITAEAWRNRKKKLEEAENAHAAINDSIREADRRRNRLARIRRVYKSLRDKQALDRELRSLDGVIRLPENATLTLQTAETREVKAAIGLETLRNQQAVTRKHLDDLTIDEPLLLRGPDIRQLDERRIEIRTARMDLPKRQAELDKAEQDLLVSARELEWKDQESSSLIDKIPTQTRVTAVTTLLRQKERLEADLASQTRSLQKDLQECSDLKKRVEEITGPPDVTRLGIIIRTVREKGDLTGRLTQAEQSVARATDSARRHLQALNPPVADESVLSQMIVPAKSQIEDFLVRERDWKQVQREIQQRIRSLQQRREEAAAVLDKVILDEQIVTRDDLNIARQYRNDLWTLLKFRHVLGRPLPSDVARRLREEPEDLINTFKPAMDEADVLADRRFDQAEAAGRISEMRRNIDKLEAELRLDHKQEQDLERDGGELKKEWITLWSKAPFEPLAPEIMLNWIENRALAISAIEERDGHEITCRSARREIQEARTQLLQELEALGIDVSELEAESLDLVMGHAMEQHDRCRSEAHDKSRLESELSNAENQCARARDDLNKAGVALDDWQAEWLTALHDLALPQDTASETVDALITEINRMRETAQTIRTLRFDRIEKIKRDIEDFEGHVAHLASELALEQGDKSADEIIVTLRQRLNEAERTLEQRKDRESELNRLNSQIAELQQERDAIAAEIAPLKQKTGATTIDELKAAVERSDLMREQEEQQARLLEDLRRNGDGKTIEELDEECASVDFDDIETLEASLEAELGDLRDQLSRAAEVRSGARRDFQEVGGDDAAAQAASRKEAALAEMSEVASCYIRLKTSAHLLQWAIERYREEKQAPLLRHAGRLFSILTRNSFTGLQITFDARDNPILEGVRRDGGTVPVQGMSSGTADQLYLALRMASVEDYLKRADALPFLADDLFINFDDERAAAGFTLLGDLGQNTQVLFFTHHRHLVDIAQATLGNECRVIDLND